jgi:hypothetical protein
LLVAGQAVVAGPDHVDLRVRREHVADFGDGVVLYVRTDGCNFL